MGSIETLLYSVGDPLYNIGLGFWGVLPKVIITAFIIVIGYMVGWLLGSISTHLFEKLKFDDIIKKLHFSKPLDRIHLSGLMGSVIKWYTFVVFVAAGANYVSLDPVSGIVMAFAEWFPNLIIALAIGLVGLLAGEFAYVHINKVNMKGAHILANLSKAGILIYAFVIALGQIVDVSVIENTLLIIVGAIGLSFAIAAGVGFGLAFKDEARAMIDTVKINPAAPQKKR